jgi:hypothetical protein
MLQRRKNLKVTSHFGLLTISLLLATAPTVSLAADRSSAYESLGATVAGQRPGETATTTESRVPQLETSSVIAAALCFAVGFGACLLLVHFMLPSLVHAQCGEIVREHLDLLRRESDVRVVVLDRESHAPLRKPRRVSTPAAETVAESRVESQQHLRVDRPVAPAGTPDVHGDDAPNSMLSQIYEQNLHLRDQLRKQSRSVKQ